MVRCPHHELEDVQVACEQVADAVELNQFISVHILVDGWGMPLLLCDSCRAIAQENLRAKPTHQGKGYDLDWGTDPSGYCVRCTGDWFARHGQGDLEALVTQARRTAGFKT
ncbi:hypothetical protein JGU66_23475 [Myxococcaceae bacterium JPH2]|nr:hypothetical protein [Myxococcaceae bacterium JPH2]